MTGIVGRILIRLDDFVWEYERFEPSTPPTSQVVGRKQTGFLGRLFTFPGTLAGVFARPVLGLVWSPKSSQRRVLLGSRQPNTRAKPPSSFAEDEKDDTYWEKLYMAEDGDVQEDVFFTDRVLFGGGSDIDNISGPDTMSEECASYPASLFEVDNPKTPAEIRGPAPAIASPFLQQAASALESTVAGAGKSLEHDAQKFQEWLNKPFGAFQPPSKEGKEEWKLF
eukprot:CAMPEP_0196727880 /NCGR_PEP_ID=MMETSP1091-20130531/8748_1 /TAXON_ID=302021 /ORGANISM="Rhodomonas sp., Strain CCMP768" /LENGTH=223 /DNA_ID=CAMNT_0042070561 /DNA_START=55 /DNA_END=726 /DNA_ORIENTATION=-